MITPPDMPSSTDSRAGIPIVDLSALRDAEVGSAAAADAVSHLLRAGEGIGFVSVTGHGVSREQTQGALSAAREFFALPDATKLAVAPRPWNLESPNRYRGYFPSSVHGKEGFDIGDPRLRGDDEELLSRRYYEPNHLPAALGAEWCESVSAYYDALSRVAAVLTAALVHGLGGDAARVSQGFRRPESLSTMRLNYYPSRATPVEISVEDGAALACETHVDSCAMTVLTQDERGGLQVKDTSGRWLDVPHDPDAFVVNLGRVFEQLSGGRLCATPHRVLHADSERISIPFFYEPAYDFEVSERSLGGREGETSAGPPYEDFLRESLASFAEYDRGD